MIAFATSFRARALAEDWDYHAWLLDQAVHSMFAQTAAPVCVAIGCHEIPASRFVGHPRVRFIPVGYEPPARDNDDMCVDKVLKLSAAAEWARTQDCDYVVFNDADDLVSNRLSGFVAAQRGASGWYSEVEMFYTYGGRFLRRYEIPGRNSGPCVVVRSDLLSFASPPFAGRWIDLIHLGGESRYLELLARRRLPVNTLAAVGIAHYRDLMEGEGHRLAPLPFPANIVINHHDSTATVPGSIGSYDPGGAAQRPTWRKKLSRVRSVAGKLATVRFVDHALRAEFSVPRTESIPRRYRAGASIFWR